MAETKLSKLRRLLEQAIKINAGENVYATIRAAIFVEDTK